MGAYRRWSAEADRSAATAAARKSFLSRFEPDDPDGRLDDLTKAKMAEAGRRAYFAELALKRHRSRRRSAG